MHCIRQHGTYFVVATIRMVSTFGYSSTANCSIIGIISFESWSAKTLA